MSNRQKIERFAKQNNLKLLRCEYVRNTEYSYGDAADSSSWQVTVEINGEPVFYDSYNGFGVEDDVTNMLCEIKHDIEDARQDNVE